MSISTETLTKPETDDDTGDSDDDVFHYVRKDLIIKSVVDGDHVVALCGETFPVTKEARPGSPVCQECKRIFERMKT